jgi:hypothetical protein
MDEALFCDRLALMQAGRIVAEGTLEELLCQPLPAPLLELDSPDAVVFDQLMQDWLEVREIIPPVLQYLTLIVPARYYVALSRAIFLKGISPLLLWTQAAALLAMLLILVWAMLARSRKLGLLP